MRGGTLLDLIVTNKKDLAGGVEVSSSLGSDCEIEEFSGVPHKRMVKKK